MKKTLRVPFTEAVFTQALQLPFSLVTNTRT